MSELAPLVEVLAVNGDPATVRNQITELQYHMLAMPAEQQIEPPVRHIFAPGLYAREMTIPAGVIVIGKTHTTEHLNVLSKGEISVITENGVQRLSAPYTVVSKPGTKRVGYAHTECVWTTFHVTDETDIAKIEAQVIAPEERTTPTVGRGEELKLGGK